MTTDTLDRVARAAAADLAARTRTVDTEAALASFGLSSPGGGRLRPGRLLGRPGRPVFVGAAAAVLVVVAVVAIGLSARTPDTPDVRTGPAAPLDPADYGPVRGTIRADTDPDLRADLHAGTDLADGSEVAIAFSGGTPGQRFGVIECAVASEETFSPPANCATLDGQADIGPEGTGTLVTSVLAAFDPRSVPYLNDCRTASCSLQVVEVLDETFVDPDRVSAFATTAAKGSGLPLRFADDAVGPLPTIAVEAVRQDDDGLVVRITGEHLTVAPTEVLAEAFAQRRTGSLANAPGDISRSVGPIEVRADGTVDQEVTVPLEVAMDPDLQASDPPTDPIRCDEAPGHCAIRLSPSGDPEGWTPRLPRFLSPPRTDYPELP